MHLSQPTELSSRGQMSSNMVILKEWSWQQWKYKRKKNSEKKKEEKKKKSKKGISCQDHYVSIFYHQKGL
jgi:hypothetical protein